MTKTPVAVLISDVHYSLSTLELADAAFRMAIDKASELNVPLIDCGDLTNDKASLRAEYLNRLIASLQVAELKRVSVYLLIGNHSLLNEKNSAHALHCLDPYAVVISESTSTGEFNFIPYQSSPESFQVELAKFPKGSTVIIHQGVKGGNAGHYIQDHSAVDAEILKDYRTVGGHYHNHHSIGTHTFVGNPYTLTFGEHADDPKGFCILFDDGTVEQVPTNLRKHVKVECDTWNYHNLPELGINDLLWLQIHGPKLELDLINKSDIGSKLPFGNNFKLDLVPTDSQVLQGSNQPNNEKPTSLELLDSLIDSSDETPESKEELKALYRGIMSCA